jgi:hypothetical protein
MAEHQVVKPEKIAQTAAVLLESQLVVPAVFRRETVDQFKGAKDDAITITVEGVLPFRTYGWRNDRSEPIKFDTYKERKIQIRFGDDIYSAVKLTDEQHDFDLSGWAKLMLKQTTAVGKGLEFGAIEQVRTAPYAVTLGVKRSALKSGLIRAHTTQRALKTPDGVRTMLVGVDFEAALLEDKELNLASSVGEAEAVSSLREATIGRRMKYNFVVAPELHPREAIALVDNAFVFLTGAPYVPASVPFGATASYKDIGLRWIRDYDSERQQDRSIVSTYKGYRAVTDVLLGQDPRTGQAWVGEHEHMVRAIRLVLDGEDSLPDGANGRPDEGFSAEQDNELAHLTGIGTKTELKETVSVAVGRPRGGRSKG